MNCNGNDFSSDGGCIFRSLCAPFFNLILFFLFFSFFARAWYRLLPDPAEDTLCAQPHEADTAGLHRRGRPRGPAGIRDAFRRHHAGGEDPPLSTHRETTETTRHTPHHTSYAGGEPSTRPSTHTPYFLLVFFPVPCDRSFCLATANFEPLLSSLYSSFSSFLYPSFALRFPVLISYSPIFPLSRSHLSPFLPLSFSLPSFSISLSLSLSPPPRWPLISVDLSRAGGSSLGTSTVFRSWDVPACIRS